MGWFGYGLYDGDETFTTQLTLLEKAGIKVYGNNVSYEEYCDQETIQLEPEHKKMVIRAYPKIIKYLKPNPPKRLLYEDWPIGWQMFADLIVNNKLPITKQIKNCALTANEWLKNYHAIDFDEPQSRLYHLKRFETRLKKHYANTHRKGKRK